MNNHELKKGDIVLCINGDFDMSDKFAPLVKTYPSFMEIYTIRNFEDDDAIRLEEIINPGFTFEDVDYAEPSFFKWRFIKLNDPLQEKEECVNEEVPVLSI